MTWPSQWSCHSSLKAPSLPTPGRDLHTHVAYIYSYTSAYIYILYIKCTYIYILYIYVHTVVQSFAAKSFNLSVAGQLWASLPLLPFLSVLPPAFFETENQHFPPPAPPQPNTYTQKCHHGEHWGNLLTVQDVIQSQFEMFVSESLKFSRLAPVRGYINV